MRQMYFLSKRSKEKEMSSVLCFGSKVIQAFGRRSIVQEIIKKKDLKLSDNFFAAYWHHERRSYLMSISMMLYDKNHGNNGLWVGFIK
jgi:hypothetical protein